VKIGSSLYQCIYLSQYRLEDIQYILEKPTFNQILLPRIICSFIQPFIHSFSHLFVHSISFYALSQMIKIVFLNSFIKIIAAIPVQ